MTASLFVSGTSVARAGHGAGEDRGPGADVAHAVSKPVVDGLEASVCGLLVTAVAAQDWSAARAGQRCPECSRIAG